SAPASCRAASGSASGSAWAGSILWAKAPVPVARSQPWYPRVAGVARAQRLAVLCGPDLDWFGGLVILANVLVPRCKPRRQEGTRIGLLAAAVAAPATVSGEP